MQQLTDMSRIEREIKKYLARVEKSMQTEKDAARERHQRREAREQEQAERERLRREMTEMRHAREDDIRTARVAREEHITMVNNRYGAFWCATVGTSFEELVYNLRHGLDQKPATRSMRLKVYDSKTRKVDVRSMIDMLNLIVGDEDILHELPIMNGQVRWYDYLYVSSVIYEFVRRVWNECKLSVKLETSVETDVELGPSSEANVELEPSSES